MLPSDLKGKACLITGSSRGIGAAVARGLGVCGAHVAVHYNNGREEAEAVAADIARASGKAIVLHGDVTETGTVERLLAETVRGFGRLDILINNAGDVIGRHLVTETTDAFFDRQVALPASEARALAVSGRECQRANSTWAGESSCTTNKKLSVRTTIFTSIKVHVTSDLIFYLAVRAAERRPPAVDAMTGPEPHLVSPGVNAALSDRIS